MKINCVSYNIIIKFVLKQNRTEQNLYWYEIHIQRIVTKTAH
jgi:hypothetical protein